MERRCLSLSLLLAWEEGSQLDNMLGERGATTLMGKRQSREGGSVGHTVSLNKYMWNMVD